MSEKKAGGYISRIEFNNGKSIEIQENDIVIFVGPNNVGKSQSLKDIYALSKGKAPTIVISKINIVKNDIPLSTFIPTLSPGSYNGNYTKYSVLGKDVLLNSNSDRRFASDPAYDEYRDLFVAELDTSARLTICRPPQNIPRNAPKTHPIHYAAFNANYRKWLSNKFKQAFGIEITPNTQYGSVIPLCIGKPILLEDIYEDEQSRSEAYAEQLSKYKQVQDQGDGVKSFTGILLYLMLDYYRTYLIDEPESFLHPPQARIMGQIIANTLKDQQQAFISTHSEEIVKGLLEVHPERIKIIRITRENDINYFSVLDNAKFSEVWNDPLLKYSNIMSSLFHKSVVLCESDSDCKIYSIIESHLKRSSNQYSETLFIHCGGKQRMAKIAGALRALDINVKLIPDIDVLNDENIFRGIIEAFNISWDSIEHDYHTIVANLHSPKEQITRVSAKTGINYILDNSNAPNLSGKEISAIQKEISTISKWKNIKVAGKAGIPAGDATKAYNDLEHELQLHGIFIVPVGELECFVKEIGGHGPEWANHLLEEYPDLDCTVYDDIKKFIASMNL